jgi:uncharacterized small protein (DUF1192 family)
MDEEDQEPRKKSNKIKNLDDMSIKALREYVVELETEILRVRDAIRDKERARTGAQNLFRS